MTTNKATFGVKSQLAKLLAMENITIRHNPAFKTASFDLKSRVLTLPVWEGISDDLYDMLVVHEVGHALDTPMEQWEAAIRGICDESYQTPKKGVCKGNKRVVKDFLNIVEDARIDKRQKRRYPGSKHNYTAGYKELFDRNVFGIEGMDVSKLPLIDRLNLHYKVPSSCLTVPFSKEERDFVDLIDKAETFDDVIDITGAVYKYAMEEEEQPERKKTDQYSSDGEEGDEGDEGDESEDGDGQQSKSSKGKPGKGKGKPSQGENGSRINEGPGPMGDEEEKKPEGKSNATGDDESDDEGDDEGKGKGKGDEDKDESDDKGDEKAKGENEPQAGSEAVDSAGPEAKTMKSFEDKMSGLLTKDRTNYIYLDTPEMDHDKIVEDWQKFIPVMENCFPKPNAVTGRYGYAQDMTKHIVRLNAWKKEESKTIGYMIKEFEMRKAADEYARTSIAKTGVIDTNKLFSYMYNDDVFRRQAVVTTGKNHGFFMILDWSGSMSELIEDTLKQMFSLVMFCQRVRIPFEVYIFRSWNNGGLVKNTPTSVNVNGFKLSNILSSRMNFRTLNRAMELIWCADKAKYSEVPMGGTPLNGAIMAADKMVLDFKKRNKLQIVNTIILTDGDSDGLYFNINHRSGPNKVIMTDTITKKNYELDMRNGHAITRDLLHILRDRTGCNLIGFFLTGNTDIRYLYWLTEEQKKDPKFVTSWKTNNFVGTTTAGYDEYYIINVPAMGKSAKTQDVSGTDVASIGASFASGSVKKKVNRVLLSQFIARIAKDDPVKRRAA